MDELSIKAICKKLHISRNTVRRVIRADAAGVTYKRSQRHKPKLTPFIDQLEQWLTADENLIRRKDRRTAMQYYTQLKVSAMTPIAVNIDPQRAEIIL